ncbi:HTH_Tnp_Tc3_2 domain-containing protein [Trichonephila clavipes]|nr:HTH_Tnp_Tc3_2 domain-containing protein [Trichonephila clavipes]
MQQCEVKGAEVPTRRRNISHSSCHNRFIERHVWGDRLISRFGPVNWPPRSCDLTPLDYYLWGYVKSLVYADKPQTLDHLEDNIRRVIADIRPQMLEKVIENWTSRLDYIRASRGSPMPEIIFKIKSVNRSSYGSKDAAIRRYWQDRVDNSRFQRHDGSGQPRATADREVRLIVRPAVTVPDSSQLTIRLLTTPTHCRAILQWCLARSGWNHADWGRIVFNDASHFQLCHENHRRRLWRHLGQRAYSAFTIARDVDPQPGVMVWGAISFDSHTPLAVHLQHSGT